MQEQDPREAMGSNNGANMHHSYSHVIRLLSNEKKCKRRAEGILSAP
jgi:hypothetical protein